MNKTYLMSSDTLKTIVQGAMGAMTFGAYHQFNTNKIMEINNQYQNKIMELNNEKHRIEMNELKEKIKVLEERKSWW
jgi:hypothetical protein